MRRVVVTGMGAITPIGNDVETFWNGLKEKKLGFGPITYFDTTDYKAKLAAEVKDFEPKDYMDPKAARRMERFAQFAVAAARQALEDSSLDMTKEDPFRVGVCVSSGIGSFRSSNGMEARSGSSEVERAVSPENPATPNGVMQLSVPPATMTSASPCWIARIASPMEFVPDAHAVLEELEHAKARGAKIYAELAGYGATGDAYHITSPAEDGSGAAKAMEYAIADAGMKPEDIDYINAHGTATHHNDLFETKAI